MFKQDFIMRIIHDMVRTILKILFNIDLEKIETVDLEDEEITEKYNRLVAMANAGMINNAENMLIEQLDLPNIGSLKMALMFYSHLNEKEDDFLTQCDFSRKEIFDGIKDVCKKYGVESFAEPFSLYHEQ